ncbi:DinB family protein [uncultured Jannaschia sp.]|uniref:DinB family protein n=1 Tax=uncultured Jannaschia sp. TaxID=293347 RepID=UPI0026315C8E|nr:DinB family protein [uncultured Jannaschia sp.]
MITPDWVRMMARYNAWQNEWLVPAVMSLPEAEVEADRGAFFGSIRKTASHLLWGDEIWLSRFTGAPRDGGTIPDSLEWASDVSDWAARRPVVDAAISDWAMGLHDLEGEVTWYSAVFNAEVSRPKTVIFSHFFNHQTHHRGQIHAMLTAAGAETGTTDLGFMPDVT